MIWKIAKKEFLLNLMTLKFAVGTILCVVLMAVFMPVLVNDYKQRLKDYNANVTANEAELRKVKVYKNFTPTIYRPPAILSVFSEGLEKQLGNSAKIGLKSISQISEFSAEVNPILSIFPTLDVSLIFKVVMSILSLLIAYDVISGECERGTLKIVLSNNVSRPQVLLGKLLAGLITLVVPLTIVFIVGLLILLSSPMVDLMGSDWARLGLMYFVSLIFISAMYNCGLLFSCIAKKSTVSLMFAIFLWVLFLIVIPNGSAYIASQLKPIESLKKFDGEVKALRDQHKSEIYELTKTFKEGGWERNEGGQGRRFFWEGAFGNPYFFMCNKIYMEAHQKYCALIEPLEIKHADGIWQIQQKYFHDNLIKQKEVANRIAQSSPMALYENLMSAFAGTDWVSFKYFINNIKVYRNEVIEYLRSKTEDYSLPSYFTTCKDGDWEEYLRISEPFLIARKAGNMEEMKKGHELMLEWIEKKKKESPSLGLQGFPQFIYSPQNVLNSIERVIPDLVLLISINVLFFVLSFVMFLKYDVR